MIQTHTKPSQDDTEIAQAAIERASALLRLALKVQTDGQRREAAKFAGLMDDVSGKAFTFAVVDEVFRCHDPSEQARHWRELVHDYGTPAYFSFADRALVRLSAAASWIAPSWVMPVIAKRLRTDSARVILDADPAKLAHHLAVREAEGFRLNVNQLGEAVLGEAEAGRRLTAVLGHIANPQVRVVSVKVSAVFSQINTVAYDATLEAIKNRLRVLYRASSAMGAFVNLDMEEYRDLALTVEAFRDVLDEPEFLKLSAGLALQAYLPDSWPVLQGLAEWSRQRMARGGADIKVRLVKGANLAMETVEAEIHGWNPAPYATKADTDANFRRMLEFGCRPENAKGVRLGVATHNLFDAALALELRKRFGTVDRVEPEMLEGMAEHQARAVRDSAGSLLLYAPVVGSDDFLGAMAYLVRRLDENTAPENFLRSIFGLKPGSPAWVRERQRFEQGWADRLTVTDESRRASLPLVWDQGFHNQPDTDWTQPAAREALARAIEASPPVEIPVATDVEETLRAAQAAQPIWEALGPEGRGAILKRAAQVMAAGRFETLACMRLDAKKAVTEGDAEISEAVDFARYYAETSIVPVGLRAEALGVVVVTPPWNFPYAIPAGGVLAALAAGNSVILKPAPETAQTAALLARQLWEGGVPRDVLRFFPCADGEVGQNLLTDPRVACVVLTGSWETARMFQGWRPSLRLYAETSGKNALVITAQADRELAIKDLVRSAFFHSGQKCSAASLAILEAEVYDDPVFRRQLKDSAASLPVGPSTDLASVVTPTVQAPRGPLLRALTTLDHGEEWLLEPSRIGDDPCFWSPGIKLGVRKGSFFHQTECFGPVLGLMRAGSLDEAIELQNGTEFGLTAGLHSLDPAEQAVWVGRVNAGNLYINRPTTGAVVRRQPFGGWKRSSVGPGAKAGGPNYVLGFTKLTDVSDVPLEVVERNYQAAWTEHFAMEHDPSGLRAESNVFRYRPCRGVVVRLRAADVRSLGLARLASRITQVPLILSREEDESDEAFLAWLPELSKTAEFLRTIGPIPDILALASFEAGLNRIEAPFTSVGRAELRYWLREQAVSTTNHRYGQIAEVQRRK